MSSLLSPDDLARLLAPTGGIGGDTAGSTDGEGRGGERWFRAIFERTSAGISLTDASGRFVACNSAFAATVGRTAEEVIGLTPAELTHPDDWASQRQQFDDARSGGVDRYTVAKRYMRPDGTAVWTELSYTAICSPGGRYQYGLGVTVDVTDRKRAEDAARRSAELFRLVWEGSADGMRLTDADGLVKAVNPAYCRMIGRPADELVGRVMTAAFATHEQAWVRDKYLRRFAAREVRRMGLAEVTLWDGRRRWFEVGDSYLDLPGEPTLMLTVFRDATDRQRAEDAVRESGERRRRQQLALLELLRDDRRTGEAGVRRVLEVVADTLRVARVSVWHLTPRQDAIRCGGLYERADGRHSAGMALSATDYPAYFTALRSEEVIAADDAATDPRTREFRDGYLTPLGITAMLDVPLRLGGRLAGVLCHEHIGPPRAWALDEQVFVLAAASVLALAAEQDERKRAEQAVRQSEERFRAAMEGSLHAVFFLTAERDAGGAVTDFRFADLNRRGAAMISRTREEVIGQRLCELLPVNRTGGFFDKYVRVVETGEPLEEEFPIAAADIAAAWLHHQVVKVGDGVVITSQDVTARKRAEIGLHHQAALLRSLSESGPDGVLVVDQDAHILSVNRRFFEVWGLVEDVAERRCDATVLAAAVHRTADPAAFRQRVEHIYAHPDLVAEEEVLLADGRVLERHTGPVRDAEGRHYGRVWYFRDVTAKKRAEEQLRQNERRLIESQRELERVNDRLREMAATDGLTGVKNRVTFDTKLSEEFERAVRYGHPLSVLMLDVDQFKSFNDTFGHPAGDAVLRAVADHLGDAIRGSDLIARYGGEEFAVLLPDTDHAGAVAVAERCRRAVAEGPWVRRAITVSVGAATLGPETPDAAALVQEADQALYRSKQTGRNRVNHGSHTIPTAAVFRAG